MTPNDFTKQRFAGLLGQYATGSSPAPFSGGISSPLAQQQQQQQQQGTMPFNAGNFGMQLLKYSPSLLGHFANLLSSGGSSKDKKKKKKK